MEIASKFLQSTAILGLEKSFPSEEGLEIIEETVKIIERAYKKATLNPLLKQATKQQQLPPTPAPTPAPAEREEEEEKKEEKKKEEEEEEQPSKVRKS